MENYSPQPKQFVLKFNEYLKSISEKPISEGRLTEYAEKNQKEFKKIQALLANDRVSRQIKEFVVAGLAEELSPKQNEGIDPYDDDFYISNLENGYRVESAPVYDENMEIASHRYTKTEAHPVAEKQKLANEINVKYEKEYHNKFYYEQEAKDALFKEKVSSGEMAFIGEMSFNDYIELRKTSPAGVSGKNFELIPCFGNDKGKWTENRKVYAYNGTEVAQ